MIIQIRGTSGSGKSTVVRKIMETFDFTPVFTDGRKQPLYYVADRLLILGHYESPCGGCDTIGSARKVFELTQKLLDSGATIVQEGLLLSEDTKWSSQLPDLRVLFLTTPVDECLSRIVSRRAKVGNEKPLNPSNTTNRVAVIERARVKLSNLGIECRRASSEQAPGIVLKWIRQASR